MVENQRTVRWVWLDLDDTLVDFKANSDAALRRVYDQWRLSRVFADVDEWLDSYHAANKELWEQYNVGAIDQPYLRMERFRRPLADAGMADAEARKISTELDEVYLDYLAQGRRLVPGALELLTALRNEGYSIGILSNGFNGVQQKKIASAGLTPYIDIVVLSDEIGINKPDARIYEYAMQRSGDMNPSHHVMIGDNVATDIAGAVGVHWHAIYFCPSGASVGSDCQMVCSLADSLDIIRCINECENGCKESAMR